MQNINYNFPRYPPRCLCYCNYLTSYRPPSPIFIQTWKWIKWKTFINFSYVSSTHVTEYKNGTKYIFNLMWRMSWYWSNQEFD